MYDYIIVGAGITGKLMAYLLSLEKSKVLLVDKKDKTHIKQEYVMLSNSSFRLLKNMISFNIDIFKIKKINNIIVNKNNIITNNIILNLKKLESQLTKEIIKNNVKILDNSNIDKYYFKDNCIKINKKSYKYSVLIAADGTLSEVRMNLIGIQRFRCCIQTKTKKYDKKCILNINRKQKTLEWLIPLKTNNLIKISSKTSKNRVIERINSIKKERVCNKQNNMYLIPDNDILFNIKNVFFIGDACGLIDPITKNSLNLHLKYILLLKKLLINNISINTKKIMKDLRYKKILVKILYLPVIHKIGYKILKIKYKEELC